MVESQCCGGMIATSPISQLPISSLTPPVPHPNAKDHCNNDTNTWDNNPNSDGAGSTQVASASIVATATSADYTIAKVLPSFGPDDDTAATAGARANCCNDVVVGAIEIGVERD
ncbi:hypothetical protein OEA41_006616 [Lepraria neglecta]|uniref:Uncharacterized protein n=1 Tax=Lepraria neglecta TaxID=209136 RepID=A0AAD9ZBL3_9LECA|nr:hypothetical protein OEA41_006616 [Lepraria neglecta]